ncbi:hypothetical protein QDR86_03990 [Acinetobacter baumannii]|uniref:hypothetical protein n=1 Tax=Acinetobacter baumannii TaxID=470 RepID=UPI00244A22BA|nr:hypothetical protein [Acinetobacter baumannii]MDH2630440.1 hypothetical protein [Acinetobacter baumannii]
MNKQMQSTVLNDQKVQFVQGDRARLLSELVYQRDCTKQAELELVYSKKFYRNLVAALVVLIVIMSGGLWYANFIKEAACM